MGEGPAQGVDDPGAGAHFGRRRRLEADPALVEESINALGLIGAKVVVTPAAKAECFGEVPTEELNRRRMMGEDRGRGTGCHQLSSGEQFDPDDSEDFSLKGAGDEGEQLSTEEAKMFVSTAAVLNYIAPDSPDIQYAVKECLRKSSNPSRADMLRLTRICRYLVGDRRWAVLFRWQENPSRLLAFVDSDFVGCVRTRESTAGCCAFWGDHLIKS